MRARATRGARCVGLGQVAAVVPPLQVLLPLGRLGLAGWRAAVCGGSLGWGVRGKGRAVDSGITQVTRGPSLTLRLAAARFTLAA